MAKSKLEIIQEIATHFSGRHYKNCYIGITSNYKTRFFDQYSVKENGHWIVRTASSTNIAREIEKEFIKREV